jgi:ABC-2 type transport system permease protein
MSAAEVGAGLPVQHPRDDAALPALPRPAGVLAASWRLLRSELRLILGRRRNQAGLVVLAAVPVIIAIAIRASGTDDGGEGLISSVTSNGIFVALTALTVELALFLPLAVAVLSGDSIAGEANLGTLRGLLTVPVSRARLLAVKYAALVIGALIGVLVVAGTGLLVGGALLGLGPTTLLSGTQIPLAEALLRLGIVVAYLTVGLAGLAAIGLFISTLTEQPIAAMITTTVVATGMWILNAIPQIAWLHPWLLVNRWQAFADAFRDPVFWDTMRTGLLVDLGYAVVFGALAWARFGTKDVTS